MKKEWKKVKSNQILEADDFYISFNPNPGTLDIFSSDHGQPETALVITKSALYTFKILNGDYRKEFEAAFPSIRKCLQVFEKNIENKSSWSN